MKLKSLLILTFTLLSAAAFAQNGGVKGKVVSRNGREALGNVTVKIAQTGQTVTTDRNGNFVFEDLEKGTYSLSFSAQEFEDLDIMVRVDNAMKDINSVIIVPSSATSDVIDDSIFAELDSDVESDASALPSSLSASKDVFNSIASYKFSEVRFNVRGYDSQYTDVMLNGIKFNDALTGYGPWSLWSGLNDATRNQNNVSGLTMTEQGLGGIGGQTNINATASQMRKGFRASVVSANQMYRFRLMLSYASGQLDNGWSYAFSISTRQGGNDYV
ncbi:MAG: carboxypeptidase-like regulatory domain-containing protein, partial [Alistipes sp.]|nr:carboxypeptidase-like regulatory domain-containing protein [Alistipes sp.]